MLTNSNSYVKNALSLPVGAVASNQEETEQYSVDPDLPYSLERTIQDVLYFINSVTMEPFSLVSRWKHLVLTRLEYIQKGPEDDVSTTFDVGEGNADGQAERLASLAAIHSQTRC